VFLANMSHEIRTPLTAILGYADLLPEMIDLENQDEEVREGLRSIATNGHRLLEVIGDILDLTDDQSRLAQPSLTRQPIELRTVLDSVASAYGVRAKAKGLTLSIVWSPATPTRIWSDAHRLRQILMKLVDNAIKFTNHGQIVIETRLQDGALEISVQDTGIGIPDEFCRRLFQPFLQADGSTTRQHQGMGLGLVLARQFAEAIGGRVNVVSRSGSGSKFSLTLPMPVGDEAADCRSVSTSTLPSVDAETLGHSARNVNSEDSLTGLHLLIADDIEANRRFLGFAAEKSGATVEAAADGSDAVERVRAATSRGRPHDVVLMDLHMPVLNGIEAIRQLRADGYEGVVIALTADAQLATRQKCLEAGSDETLTKPISRADLVRHCRELLSRERANA
jgi:CheY-like chemotaxis protein